MIRVVLVIMLASLLTGCPENEIRACWDMCQPNRVDKFENHACYCQPASVNR